jgi:septal ring-binding cell division protein DamX
VVQFTATRSRDTARAVAARVHVPGAEPHILPDTRKGKPLYLVVVGPYPTSAKADSVGRTAHAQYYVRQNPLQNP